MASLTKNQIYKLLEKGGMDEKEHAKLLKRKAQTSREDLASTFLKILKKSVQDSKQ